MSAIESRSHYPLFRVNNHSTEGETKRELENLSKSIIRDFVGVDQYLRESNRHFIIDGNCFRPIRTETITKITPLDAIGKFGQDINEIDRIGLENLPLEWQGIRTSLVAQIVYLNEEEKIARGENKTPYREYLLQTSGFEPKLIPWAELDKNYQEVVHILQRMGEDFDENSENSVRHVIRRRNDITRYDSKEKFEADFKVLSKQNRYMLSRILGDSIFSVKYDFEWQEVDEFWRFWEVIDPSGDKLRGNYHERHREKYDRGLVELYASHEDHHFLFGDEIKKRIKEGKIDPAAGILTIPGPVVFQLEGLAQTISEIANYDISLDGQLAIAIYRMEKRALNNGLFMLENGEQIDSVVQELRKYMIQLRSDEIRKLLREGTEKPFERAYLPVYGRSDYDLIRLKELLEEGIKKLIPYWHSMTMTRDQFLNPPLEALLNN